MHEKSGDSVPATLHPVQARDTPLRVLVIDDSEVARTIMAQTLREAGYLVFELVSAIGATRLVTEKTVDVVVIDVQMPAMNGDRLAALFRRNPRFNRVGLVLVSDSKEETLWSLAESVGADAVVSKGNVPTELVTTVS